MDKPPADEFMKALLCHTLMIIIVKTRPDVSFQIGDILYSHEISSQQTLSLKVIRHLGSRIFDDVRYQEIQAFWELDLISKIKENSNEEDQANAVTRRNDKV